MGRARWHTDLHARCPVACLFFGNVSNPAQISPASACHAVELEKFRAMGERAKVTDGTRLSSVPQSAPPTAGIHWECLWEAVNDTYTADSRRPIAKDVPVLRSDHAPPQDLLPGMWQVSQTSLKPG